MTKAAFAFRALHDQPAAFVIPNPWDTGSARILAALGFSALATTSAQAIIIDFVDLTENTLGESGWSTLTLNYPDFSVDITGTKNSQSAFAYLDWRHAGLGVCGSVDQENINQQRTGNRGNVCNPGSDDNVTNGEALFFSFSENVIINNIWLNNTHDRSYTIIDPDLVNIGGVDVLGAGNGYAPGSTYNSLAGASAANALGPFEALANIPFNISFVDEQFYVSAMEVTLDPRDPDRPVPVPGSLVLLVTGLFGLTYSRRNQPS